MTPPAATRAPDLTHASGPARVPGPAHAPGSKPVPAVLRVLNLSTLDAPSLHALAEQLAAHGAELIQPPAPPTGTLLHARPLDPAFWQDVAVVFGQPTVADCLAAPALRWVALTTAGYTRFDQPELQDAFRRRNLILTNASSVFADACAQHVLAMLLGLNRQLPQALREQDGAQGWLFASCRQRARLLTGQTVLLLGFGAIGRRLAELLQPFRVKLLALRRKRQSEPGVFVLPEERLTAALGEADHIVNLLPDNADTLNYMNARRLRACRPGARFYNVGRGTTVDQGALLAVLREGLLDAAYLDVTDPEPLPPGHPLWNEPRCFITPHSAGGRSDENATLLTHFLHNFTLWRAGQALTDQVW